MNCCGRGSEYFDTSAIRKMYLGIPPVGEYRMIKSNESGPRFEGKYRISRSILIDNTLVVACVDRSVISNAWAEKSGPRSPSETDGYKNVHTDKLTPMYNRLCKIGDN